MVRAIEAVIATEKVSAVNAALKKVGVGGVTCCDARGRGAGGRAQVTSGRGTEYYTPEFHSRCVLRTVVDDSKVNAAVDAIINAASTGSPGDGKIFISSIEDAVDIGSKKRGSEAV
ncbi:MAG: P-II family nitrogen regulator [Nitrososphaerales archaeon]